jgi:hypothetical protein
VIAHRLYLSFQELDRTLFVDVGDVRSVTGDEYAAVSENQQSAFLLQCFQKKSVGIQIECPFWVELRSSIYFHS